MKYCNRCLYPENHPLNILFNQEGICSGCQIHEEKDTIEWNKREEKLKSVLSNFKDNTQNNYDCIIPVSGARDSFFIVDTIKKKYGLNPLLVTYNKQYNTKEGIVNLAKLRTSLDCDLMTLTVNPETIKKITKVTLQKMGSMYWHCIAGQTVFPVQIAVKFKIPLIIWGAHQGCDQVGMFSHLDEVEMTRKYRKEHDLMGYEAEDLLSDAMSLTEDDVRQFMYPHDKEIEKVGVRGIYLNNYIRWDTKKQHEKMLQKYSYKILMQERTFDTYSDVDCFHYSDIHDYIKFLKYGYGKATDHATREIRLKRLSREEGINFVKTYQNKEPKTLELFLKWIGITKRGFYYYINQFRDQNIWKLNDDHKWILKDSITNDTGNTKIEKARLEKKETYSFAYPPLLKKESEEYTLIGRGHEND